jgi:hypothetical protein
MQEACLFSMCRVDLFMQKICSGYYFLPIQKHLSPGYKLFLWQEEMLLLHNRVLSE